MTMDEITARKSEIETEIRSEGITEERLDALQAEVETLEAEERTIIEAAEERKAEVEAVINAPTTEVVETPNEVKNITEERKMFDIASVEYRNAFMANLVGKATEEQRSILADTTSAYGTGAALPVGLDKEVWDQVTESHPILSDIDRYVTGIVIKVTKMTPAAISKKHDADANTEETYTTAEVTLAGADYHSYINISYAEAQMSQGAMEAFLVKNIAGVIGDALAADVFARIISDAGSAQKVATTGDNFADVKSALGKAKKADKAVIYAPSSLYYDLVGAVNTSGAPFNMGTVLGCEIKKDNAATCITVVDPSKVVLNVVADTTVETQKDVANAQFVIGGYCRAEAALRVTTAAAYIG